MVGQLFLCVGHEVIVTVFYLLITFRNRYKPSIQAVLTAFNSSGMILM